MYMAVVMSGIRCVKNLSTPPSSPVVRVRVIVVGIGVWAERVNEIAVYSTAIAAR